MAAIPSMLAANPSAPCRPIVTTMATKKRSRHPAVAAASDRPGPSGARVAFEDDAEENGDADEEGEEGELLEPLHGREEEEDEGAHGSATGYYSSHRRRKSTRLKSKLAYLPGGEPRQLAGRVHNIMRESSDDGLSEWGEQALHERFSPLYDQWRLLLHGGFSLLLHGFGSKKQLAEDFVRTAAAAG